MHLIDADDRDTSASSITVHRRERNIIGRTVKDTRTACVTRRVRLCTVLSRISGCHRRAQRRRITGQSDAFVSRPLQATEFRFPLRIISTNDLGTAPLSPRRVKATRMASVIIKSAFLYTVALLKKKRNLLHTLHVMKANFKQVY